MKYGDLIQFEPIESVIQLQSADEGEEEVRNMRTLLEDLKGFLESLQTLTSPGKLKNFRHEATEVARHRQHLQTLDEVESLKEVLSDLETAAAHLFMGEPVLPT